MKSAIFIIIYFLMLILLSMSGCATLEDEGASGTNWALAENGGKVTVFLDNPIHPASTLNNGITSSENWEQGEGWQISTGVGYEEAYITIELPKLVAVSKIRIYTIDPEEYKARNSGMYRVQIQYESTTSLKIPAWANIKRHSKSIGARGNIIRDKNGIIDFRFEPVRTEKIRLSIYSINSDITRLAEIQVFGA